MTLKVAYRYILLEATETCFRLAHIYDHDAFVSSKFPLQHLFSKGMAEYVMICPHFFHAYLYIWR